jgi:nitrate reductase molybdenum cofactor assembly chaperone NarJ/NarW
MRPSISDADRTGVFAVASRLLQYPDQELLDCLDPVQEIAGRLNAGARKPLLDFVAYLRGAPLLELQASYVETFDLRNRNCLDLTFPRTGDTRRRGMALWDFSDLYRRHGYSQTSGDLPDFLPALLELAAEAEPEDREPFETLVRHRPEVTLLRASLEADASPYAGVLRALEFMLPKPSAEMRELARRLAEEGPPKELAGVAPDFVWLGENPPGGMTACGMDTEGIDDTELMAVQLEARR